MSKISIRFYNDQLVRAVWRSDQNKWYYSVLDVVGTFNRQDYRSVISTDESKFQ